MTFTYKIESSIDAFPQDLWDQFADSEAPFLQYPFLRALEHSDSVGGDSGWEPRFLRVSDCHSNTIAVLPMYLKRHSYGEYVFDHSWANAYHQHGIEYYPKLLIAVPFTPVTATKLMVHSSANYQDVLTFVLSALEDWSTQQSLSSIHWLFCSVQEREIQTNTAFCERHSVQFIWRNRDYRAFDDYLARFTSRKRKDIRKERKKVSDAGIRIETKSGPTISASDMDFFYQCYCQTYLKRSGHTGYLTRSFFEQIYATFADQILLVIAYHENQPIAAAMYLFNATGLYGRYWGAMEEVDGLHFECCYYSGIEFAIQHRLPLFNPGTQGEHKILRGFEPELCFSAHHCLDQRFHTAVEDFVLQEQRAIAHYYEQTRAVVPFKQNPE